MLDFLDTKEWLAGWVMLVLVLVLEEGRDVGAEASVGNERQTPAGQRFHNNGNGRVQSV